MKSLPKKTHSPLLRKIEKLVQDSSNHLSYTQEVLLKILKVVTSHEERRKERGALQSKWQAVSKVK